MPRSTITFVCTDCGGESLRWAGQCPHCQAWNTLQEFQVRKAGAGKGAPRAKAVGGGSKPVALGDVDAEAAPRRARAWDELHRVVGGERGVGKSTLLMHAAAQVAAGGGKVLYVSGEESAQQIRMRGQRLGVLNAGIFLLAENDLDLICDSISAEPPQLVIIDSIQTVMDAGLEGGAGSVTQVRESAARLMRLAKETGVPIFLVGHVTKEGSIAGPRVLEHIVDTVLYLESDRPQELPNLRATKNRFGSSEEIGVFAMGERGLEEVPDPSAAMLSQVGTASAGTAVVVVMEGTRPLLLEIQSLGNKANTNFPPRRVANGFDLNRVHMLLAVLDRRGKTPLGQHDVFVNVAGGIRITEPAADLGLALSIAGNQRSQPLPEGLVVLGELGLAGEGRSAGRAQRRLPEAAPPRLPARVIPSR